MLEDIFGCYHRGHPVGSGQGCAQCPAMTTKRFLASKITGGETTQSPGDRHHQSFSRSVITG